MVAVINPPIMATASGFWLSEPMPVDNAAGNSPSIAIRAVITTGRTRAATPCRMASSRESLLRRF